MMNVFKLKKGFIYFTVYLLCSSYLFSNDVVPKGFKDEVERVLSLRKNAYKSITLNCDDQQLEESIDKLKHIKHFVIPEETPLSKSGLELLLKFPSLFSLSFTESKRLDIQDLKVLAGVKSLNTLTIKSQALKRENSCSALTSFPHLKVLSLEGVKLTTQDLTEIKKIKSLKNLTIDKGGLTNDMLKVIGEMTHLKMLTLGSNLFDSKGFQHLAPLKNLMTLLIVPNYQQEQYFSYREEALLNRTLPNSQVGFSSNYWISPLNKKTESYFIEKGQIIETKKFSNKRVFIFSGDQLAEKDFLRFKDLPPIQVVFIKQDCKLNEKGFRALKDLPFLDSLWYEKSEITSKAPKEITGLSGLKYLNMVNVDLSKKDLENLEKMFSLNNLVISDNTFENAKKVFFNSKARITKNRTGGGTSTFFPTPVDFFRMFERRKDLPGYTISIPKDLSDGFKSASIKYDKNKRLMRMTRDKIFNSHLLWLKNLRSPITNLDLSYSRVTDSGLKHLVNLYSLTHLSLRGTKITGDGLMYLDGLKNLKYLNVQNTKIPKATLLELESIKPELVIKK